MKVKTNIKAGLSEGDEVIYDASKPKPWRGLRGLAAACCRRPRWSIREPSIRIWTI